jgi:hypothetical protein
MSSIERLSIRQRLGAKILISTRKLDGMPDIEGFCRLTQALATLDAIISPEWEYRYYSFNSLWADCEMMASMRNGTGDHWFALLSSDGIALHGLAHEAPMFRPGKPWPGIFEDLSKEFGDKLLREPAFMTEHSTFCIWRRFMDDHWSCGSIEFLPGADPDGSEDLLYILSGEAEHYTAFARQYYEVDVQLSDVDAIYQHHPLTDQLVRRLNPKVMLASLTADLEEIGYPASIT